MSVGGIFGDAWQLYTRFFTRFFVIAAIVSLVVNLVNAIVGSLVGSGAGAAVLLAFISVLRARPAGARDADRRRNPGRTRDRARLRPADRSRA